jgi:dCMP deaminase
MFLHSALHWSKRSHDIHTKCGCVFVINKTIISHGYNGFIREIDDSILPLTRPEKYPFMMHAEQNAIFNCARNGISCNRATAYITGIPCTSCLQFMYQSGIVKIVYSNFNSPHMCKENIEEQNYQTLIKLMEGKMEIVFIPNQKLDSI